MTQQINELYQEARAEALQRLLQNPDESLDRDCLELYAAWKKDLESAWKERDPEDDEADVNAWQNLESYKRLRARLGTIAEDDVELARLGMRSMHVKRISMVLEFNWLQFNSVDAGLPALADWLCGQQCAQTKFEVQGNGFLFDE